MTAMALLIMDVQRGIVERYEHDGGYLDRLATAIAAARRAGIPVTYVTVAFRPGYPGQRAQQELFRRRRDGPVRRGRPRRADPGRDRAGTR